MKNSYTLFNASYHAKLLDLFIQTTMKSIMANSVGIVFILISFYEYISTSLWLTWGVLQLAYLIMRKILANKLCKALFSQKEAVPFLLKSTVALIFFGALLWATLMIIAALYLPLYQQLIIFFVLLGLIAGSIATLSSFFITFRVFFITLLAGIIISLIIINNMTAYLIIILAIFFGFIVHSAAFILYSNMKENVEMADELALSKKKLSEFNSTLEDRIEEEVIKSKEQMNHFLHQTRLAQMGEMLSMIAHQWRQPLTSITTSVASIKFKSALNETLDKEFLEKNLNDIEEYALHLSTTINDFRGFFKANKEKSTINFVQTVQETLSLINSSLVVHNISLDIDIHSNVEFDSYPNEVKQVILNIIKNAEEILIEKDILDPQIFITIDSSKNDALLKIEDNAGGIDEAIIDKIFDPYFTTKVYSDGTGLGLYMSQKIIQEHCKGKLSVENTSKGALFTLAIHRKV